MEFLALSLDYPRLVLQTDISELKQRSIRCLLVCLQGLHWEFCQSSDRQHYFTEWYASESRLTDPDLFRILTQSNKSISSIKSLEDRAGNSIFITVVKSSPSP